MMAASLLDAVPAVDGRECNKEDVFKDGDYRFATIPNDCTWLDLWGGNIGDIGATSLAEALKGNTALATLRLGNTNIGDIGATAIAEALNGNTALKTLNLYDNKIGDIGATALEEALKGNTAVTSLPYLEHGNNIKDSTITASIEVSLADNRDPTKRAAKKARISPCYGKTSSSFCNNHGTPSKKGNICMCKSCDAGYSGAKCEVKVTPGMPPGGKCEAVMVVVARTYTCNMYI